MLDEMDDKEAKDDGKALNPVQLLGRVRQAAPQFKGRRQQDAHELLISVVSAVDDEQLAQRKRKLDEQEEGPGTAEKEQQGAAATSQIMSGAFSGRLCSSVVCKKCSTVSRRWEPFVDLSLELPADPKGKKPKKKSSSAEAGKKGKRWGKKTKDTEPAEDDNEPSRSSREKKKDKGGKPAALGLRYIKGMKPKELKKVLKERGLSTQGNKKDLVARLMTSELERGEVPKTGSAPTKKKMTS